MKFFCLIVFSLVIVNSYCQLIDDELGDGSWKYAIKGDVDNDGDIDLVVGYEENYKTATRLYLNDGKGLFQRDDRNFFQDLNKVYSGFCDIDGDNDLDLVTTGTRGEEEYAVIYYMNDGTGKFSGVEEMEIFGVCDGAIVFADFNNDTYPDLMISGRLTWMHAPRMTTHLYFNDGYGNFKIDSLNKFIGVEKGSFAVGDVDGDGDIDVFLSGTNFALDPVAKLYLNNGRGVFTEGQVKTKISDEYGERIHSSEFCDVDDDGDLDLYMIADYFITEEDRKHFYKTSTLLLNDGSGNFQEEQRNLAIFDRINQGVFMDFNGDKKKDLLVSCSGRNKLLENTGGRFTSMTNQPFDNAVYSDFVVTGDFDNNGFMDVISLTGSQRHLGSTIYLNHNGVLSMHSSRIVPRSYYPFGVFDMNGDTFPDLINPVGEQSLFSLNSPWMRLNDGSGKFSHEPWIPKIFYKWAITGYADIDNDGDVDVLMKTLNITETDSSCFMINNGTGDFSYKPTRCFQNSPGDIIEFVDIDGDEDLDVIIAGKDLYEEDLPKGNFSIFENLGDWNFVKRYSSNDLDVFSLHCQDFNHDGRIDIHIGRWSGGTMLTNRGGFRFITKKIKLKKGERFASAGNFRNNGETDLIVESKAGDDEKFGGYYLKMFTIKGNGHISRTDAVILDTLEERSNSITISGDVNNDSINDLIVFRSCYSTTVCNSQIYLGTKGGGFFKINSQEIKGGPNYYDLVNVHLQLIDLDNDGDQDLYLHYTESESQPEDILYVNDGNGNFTR